MAENDKKDEMKGRTDKVKEITDKLENGLKELFDSEKYAVWLRTMSRFHGYSLNNTLLIAMQKPDSTLVAGYEAWQKKFGRQVRKGEKAIRILAPTPYKKIMDVRKVDPVTQKPMFSETGETLWEQKEVTRTGYKIAYVFDVSQTEGRELPQIGVSELTGDVKGFPVFFDALKRSCPVPIGFEQIQDGAKGYYHRADDRIALQEGMSQMQTIKTAIHEMAHQRLHSIYPAGMDETQDMPVQTRSSREVEAESVAYTVCQHFGIDTADYSFAYIAAWSKDKDAPELKASLQTIRKAASEMIDEIEENYQTLINERENPERSENPKEAEKTVEKPVMERPEKAEKKPVPRQSRKTEKKSVIEDMKEKHLQAMKELSKAPKNRGKEELEL